MSVVSISMLSQNKLKEKPINPVSPALRPPFSLERAAADEDVGDGAVEAGDAGREGGLADEQQQHGLVLDERVAGPEHGEEEEPLPEQVGRAVAGGLTVDAVVAETQTPGREERRTGQRHQTKRWGYE